MECPAHIRQERAVVVFSNYLLNICLIDAGVPTSHIKMRSALIPLLQQGGYDKRGPFLGHLVEVVLLLLATSCFHQYYTYKSRSQSHETWSVTGPSKALVLSIDIASTCRLPFLCLASTPTFLPGLTRHS